VNKSYIYSNHPAEFLRLAMLVYDNKQRILGCHFQLNIYIYIVLEQNNKQCGTEDCYLDRAKRLLL